MTNVIQCKVHGLQPEAVQTGYHISAIYSSV